MKGTRIQIPATHSRRICSSWISSLPIRPREYLKPSSAFYPSHDILVPTGNRSWLIRLPAFGVASAALTPFEQPARLNGKR